MATYPTGAVHRPVDNFCWDTGTMSWIMSTCGSSSGGGGPIQDGADPTIEATVLDLTDSNPLTVAIVDSNGDQITSFGSGAIRNVATKTVNGFVTDTDVDCTNCASVIANIESTDLNATIQVRVSVDGSTFTGIDFVDITTDITLDGAVQNIVLTGAAVHKEYLIPIPPGAVTVRFVVSAYAAGSAVLTAVATTEMHSTFAALVRRDATKSTSGLPVLAYNAAGVVHAPIVTSSGGYGLNEDGWVVHVASGNNPTAPVSAKLTDGTTAVTVLPASTAAVATDKPLVVAAHPSSTQPVSAASLPLPTGAATLVEQQTQSASLSVIDDWDESDRAKVNPIVGQAGVAAGTGVDGATVQRVSLATNVPLPAGTNAIGKLSANSGVDIGDVTVDNAAGAAAVNIQDGGNSITVDGAVTSYTTDTVGIPAVLGALNAVAVVALEGRSGAGVSFGAGTLAAEVRAEVSFDGGTTYPLPTLFSPMYGTAAKSLTAATVNSYGYGIDVPGGATHVRVRVSIYFSGSVTATLRATNRAQPTATAFEAESGVASLPQTAVWVGGRFGFSTQFQGVDVVSGTPFSNANGFVTRPLISDGTNGPVAVKAASTAPVAADKALVVGLNPLGNTVQGAAASASAKSGNPVQIGGVFNTTQPTVTTGQMVEAQASARGSLLVAPGIEGFESTSNIVSISTNENVAAPTAAVWYLKRRWALPAGAIAVPLSAWSSVTTAGSRTIVAIINNLGNLNLSTNTFTAGNSVASPFFYGRLFGVVTTVMSATADTITPTYTDELGNSQATAGVAFASASPVGNAYEFPLAAAAGPQLDTGVRAVTAATDSAAPTGVVTFFGVNVLLESNGAANDFHSVVLQNVRLAANEEIAIFQIQAATTLQQRGAGITLSLR